MLLTVKSLPLTFGIFGADPYRVRTVLYRIIAQLPAKVSLSDLARFYIKERNQPVQSDRQYLTDAQTE